MGVTKHFWCYNFVMGLSKRNVTNKNTEKKVMKTGSENFIFAEGKEWETAADGVVRQIMGYNDDIMVVNVKFEKGAVGAVHHHIHSLVTYVECG